MHARTANRDQRVNVFDMLIARNHATHFLNALKLISVPDGKGGWIREFDAAESQDRSPRKQRAERAVDLLLAGEGV